MSTCEAFVNPRAGVTFRCDRQEGHDGPHYDFHQDADWRADETPWTITVEYRTVRK